jgi:hypothetical protein
MRTVALLLLVAALPACSDSPMSPTDTPEPIAAASPSATPAPVGICPRWVGDGPAPEFVWLRIVFFTDTPGHLHLISPGRCIYRYGGTYARILPLDAADMYPLTYPTAGGVPAGIATHYTSGRVDNHASGRIAPWFGPLMVGAWVDYR